jgi:hypothetical protein
VILLRLLVGCSDQLSDFEQVPDTNVATPPVSARIRVDVIPPQVSDVEDLRALPTSVTRDIAAAEVVDLGVLELALPEALSGELTALRTNPFVRALPAERVPVLGTVELQVPGTIASWSTRTDAEGRFEALLVPDSEYTLAVIPDDPLLPAWVGALADAGDLEPLDLGLGAPIYGLVGDPAGPIAGAAVYAISPDGVRTAAASTDDTGFYQLRVQPGTWSVVCEGRPLGQDPEVRTAPLRIEETGRYVPFTHPAELDAPLVAGTVSDRAGRAVPDARVRFRSTALAGYDDPAVSASWSGEVTVSGNGSWLLRVVPGTYDVEVLPPVAEDGPAQGPALSTGVVVDDDLELDLATSTLRPVSGRVTDGSAPLSDARITCREVGFDEHEYVTFTAETGRFEVDLPPVPLQCEVTPPGDRTDLAVGLVAVDGADRGELLLRLGAGVEVAGEVEIDGEPAPGAVVQIRGSDGLLLGFDLVDDDGRFSVNVDPSLAASTTE